MQTDEVIFDWLRKNYGLKAAVKSMNALYDSRQIALYKEYLRQLQHFQMMTRKELQSTSQQPTLVKSASPLSMEISRDEMFDLDTLKEVEHDATSVVTHEEATNFYKIKYLCNFCPKSCLRRFASTCGVRKHCRKEHKERIKGTNGKIHLYSTPVYD